VTNAIHPAAPHHLPPFLPGADGSDWLLTFVGMLLVVAILGFGVMMLHLHSLPERLAHRGHKLQFQVVAVLGLLALFTHIHLFWVAALLLALVDIPDIGGHLRRIAGAAERMAGLPPGGGDPSGDGPQRPPGHEPPPASRLAAPQTPRGEG
jgi:hypothetical protein